MGLFFERASTKARTYLTMQDTSRRRARLHIRKPTWQVLLAKTAPQLRQGGLRKRANSNVPTFPRLSSDFYHAAISHYVFCPHSFSMSSCLTFVRSVLLDISHYVDLQEPADLRHMSKGRGHALVGLVRRSNAPTTKLVFSLFLIYVSNTAYEYTWSLSRPVAPNTLRLLAVTETRV